MVNKKKVQEVKIWLEGHLVSGRAVVPKVLLLTGRELQHDDGDVS